MEVIRGAIHPLTCETCGATFYVKKQRIGVAKWCSRYCRYGEERDRIEARISRMPDDGCWIWTGNSLPSGYGVFSRNTPAHRKVYELYVGPIPPGLDLDHLCRVRNCVRPDHLEPVTHRENIQRGESYYGHNARATTCPKGHPYDEANTYIRPDGRGRDCLTCRRARSAEPRRRKP